MNKKYKAAARFMSSMYGLMACKKCNGWSRGFNMQFWVSEDDKNYAAAISKTGGDEHCQGETLSFKLTEFVTSASELGFSLKAIHYTDPALFNVSLYHVRLEVMFVFYVCVNPLELVIPASLLEGLVEQDLEDVSFEDVGEDDFEDLFRVFLNASLAVKQENIEYKDILLTTHAMLQNYGIPLSDLSLSTVLPTLVARVGYEYNHERVAKLPPTGRAGIVAWSLEQMVRLRCKQSPQKPPDKLRRYLRPIAKSTSE